MKKPSIKIFGIQLVLEANIIALTALLLSISSLTINMIQIMRGADVKLSVGERVNLVRWSHPVMPGSYYLLVNARLDYVNSGAIGRDAIVSKERLIIKFGERLPYEYRWLHFELYLPDDTGGPKAITQDVAHSIIIPGAGAESHQTTFVAFRDAKVWMKGAKSAYVPWDNFLEWVELGERFELNFVAHDRRDIQPYKAACTVLITNAVLSTLKNNNWATALCESDEQLQDGFEDTDHPEPTIQPLPLQTPQQGNGMDAPPTGIDIPDGKLTHPIKEEDIHTFSRLRPL